MKQISFLIKPASSLCNLRCRYCFYHDEAANRSCPTMGMMQDSTVDLLLQQAFEHIQPGGTIQFAFQGGEPTLAGLPFFRRFAAKAKAGCPQGVSLQFSIQTNGTLLTEEWAEFLYREHFLVGLSVDGFKQNHNTNRLDAQGQGTWNTVLKSLRLLQQHRVEVNLLCVVTAACSRSPEKAYNELKKLGTPYLQFIACLDPLGQDRGQQPYSLTPKAYGTFLCRLFDLWYADWKTGRYHSVRLFEDYVHLLLGNPSSTCSTCGRCGAYFLVEGDGTVYPCDFFALDGWELGKLGEHSLLQLTQSPAAQRFAEQSRQKPAACSGCRWQPLCNGGCPNDWVWSNSQPQNYYCDALRQLLEHAMPRLLEIAQAEARLLRQQR